MIKHWEALWTHWDKFGFHLWKSAVEAVMNVTSDFQNLWSQSGMWRRTTASPRLAPKSLKITLWTICNSAEQENICVFPSQKQVANARLFVSEVPSFHLYVATMRTTLHKITLSWHGPTKKMEDFFSFWGNKEERSQWNREKEGENEGEEPDSLFSLRGCHSWKV